MNREIRKHPNPFSQESLDRAIDAYVKQHGEPAGGAVVLYADYEQGGAVKLGGMARIGDHFSFEGNFEHKPDEKWRGHAEVAWAW